MVVFLFQYEILSFLDLWFHEDDDDHSGSVDDDDDDDDDDGDDDDKYKNILLNLIKTCFSFI